MEINETWNNEETGQLVIGKNEDDIIEINGVLKAGKKRSRFTVIVSHDDITPEMDYQLNPNVDEFQTIFRKVSFVNHDIVLDYNVGNIGNQLKIKATIINSKL